MTSLEKAILATLCYADVFDYPLTERETWKYLIGKSTTLVKFRSALKNLLVKKRVFQKDHLYTLPKRVTLAELRKNRERIAKGKIRLAKKAARILSYIPTVNLIGVSGALAMHNAPGDDDIDFFLITSPRTLWTTRLLVTLLLDLLRLRRKPRDTKYRNKICLNMFMDRKYLELPKKEQDLYSAHEVAQLKVFVNKAHAYEDFLRENAWVKRFLPHAFATTKHMHHQNDRWGRVVGIAEPFCKWLQLTFMRKRRTREVTTETLLKFHPVDAREKVMGEYKVKLDRFG